jgi:protein TonB
VAAPVEVFAAEEPLGPPPEFAPVAVPEAPPATTATVAGHRLSRPLPVRREAAAPPAPAPTRPAPAPSPASAPAAVRAPPARYPVVARRRGLEGDTVLRLRVDERGAVAEVHVETSSGHPILDRAAMDAARAWRFAPGLRDGRPEPRWIRLPVRFRLR